MLFVLLQLRPLLFQGVNCVASSCHTNPSFILIFSFLSLVKLLQQDPGETCLLRYP